MDLNLGSTRALIDECRRQGLLRNQCAYVLATAFWETARTMKPVREMGGEKYLKSKKYYPYVGMGFVQLTWDYNYKKASDKLGVDFVKNPKLLLEPKYAVPIAVTGMREGWFTKKKLSDYITLKKSDFVNARRIINGVDKKNEIAKIAREYDMDLKVAEVWRDKPASARPAPVATIPPIEPEAFPVPAPAPAKEVIRAVQQRLLDLGYPPGGIDGILGKLTSSAIRDFRSENGLPIDDTIDDKMQLALSSAKPRKLAPERMNATASEVASKVPEANMHWWSKYTAAGVGAPALIAGAADAISPAKSYIEPLREMASDVPGWVWLGLVGAIAIALFLLARRGEAKSVEAFQSGERL